LIPTQIVNLSSHQLSTYQIKVLNKGLGFCPTPTRLHRTDYHTDILRFIRQLRLQHDKHVSNHFTKTHKMNDLSLTVIDVAPHDVTSRILRETSWIRTMVTMEPHGLNCQTAT
jgi:hypothetical protein